MAVSDVISLVLGVGTLVLLAFQTGRDTKG